VSHKYGAGEGKYPNKRGIIINFTDGTVSGGWGVVARITKSDDAYIEFSGTGPNSKGGPGDTTSVSGSIDRVTGPATISTTSTLGTDPKTGTTVTLPTTILARPRTVCSENRSG
jgi:hypothetical protein